MVHTCNPNTLGSRSGQITRTGVRDQPGQLGEIPSLLKYKNLLGMVVHACNPNYSGGWGTVITWTWEAEVAVSRDCATTFQSGWQSKTLSQKKNTNKIDNLLTKIKKKGEIAKICKKRNEKREITIVGFHIMEWKLYRSPIVVVGILSLYNIPLREFRNIYIPIPLLDIWVI